MKRIVTTWLALCLVTVAFGQQYPVDTLYKTGPLENRINVVILGDGFTEQEMPKFASKAKKFADFFRAYDPYNRYHNYFNFFAIRTPSKESGITNPGTAPDAYPEQPVGKKDTFFGTEFGSNIHRLVTISKWDVFANLMASQFPTYDLVVVLANTTFYGGSGGSIAVHTLHDQANRIGVHEVGHTFGHLNDEYWAGAGYGWEAPNMTAENNPALIKWKNWLNSPPIGIHTHGSTGGAEKWYKPTNAACLMEYLDKQLCAVCREATTETILALVNPVEAIEPDNAAVVKVEGERRFKLKLVKPEPNTLQVEWRLNGELIAANVDEVVLDANLTPDTSTLIATVFDSTTTSRKDDIRDVRTKTMSWSLSSATPNVFRVVASKDTICDGETVKLAAYSCSGTLSWSTTETGAAISVKPEKTTTYQAYCKVQGQPIATVEVPVVVFPLPAAAATNGGPYFVGSTIELSAQGGDSYEWNGPRNFSANAPNASIPDAGLNNAGIYEVKVTGANGCSKTAQTEVKVDPILSIPTNPEEWVRVSPNPAADYISVETMLPGESVLVLYDQAGREVVTKFFKVKTEIPLRVPAGLYLYRFTNGSRETSGKVVVQ
jgi:hypothetical protein